MSYPRAVLNAKMELKQESHTDSRLQNGLTYVTLQS